MHNEEMVIDFLVRFVYIWIVRRRQGNLLDIISSRNLCVSNEDADFNVEVGLMDAGEVLS